MTLEELKPGDFVSLKSGSIIMLVRRVIEGEGVHCDWQAEDGTPHSAVYVAEQLVKRADQTARSSKPS